MFYLFTKLLYRRPRPQKIEIVRRDPTRITLPEWRSQPELIKRARAALDSPDVRSMLDVMANSTPAHNMARLDLPMETRAVLQAQTEGYMAALHDFELLGVFVPPEKHLEATFAPPEQID